MEKNCKKAYFSFGPNFFKVAEVAFYNTSKFCSTPLRHLDFQSLTTCLDKLHYPRPWCIAQRAHWMIGLDVSD